MVSVGEMVNVAWWKVSLSNCFITSRSFSKTYSRTCEMSRVHEPKMADVPEVSGALKSIVFSSAEDMADKPSRSMYSDGIMPSCCSRKYFSTAANALEQELSIQKDQ